MNYQQSFFIGTQFHGTFPRQPRELDGQFYPPDSLLFFCRKCGEVYARAPVVNGEGLQQRWQSMSCICHRCQSEMFFEVPGSVWLSWDTSYQKALPKSILERELILTINFVNSRE